MIVIFGASGFLGSNLVKESLNRKIELHLPSREDFFFEAGQWVFSNSLKDVVSRADAVINCVGITDLMVCERNPTLSIAVNGMLPHGIARLVSPNAYFIHISTDAVYDKLDNFSNEEERPVLSNKYARHKYVGESACSLHPNSLVLRTSFFGYNPRGAGLVNHFYKALLSGCSVNGWSDSFTSSLHVNHLTKALLMCFSQKMTGVFNLGTQSPYTKYEFLKRVAENLDISTIIKKTKSTSHSQVRRNTNLGMDSKKFYQHSGMQPWAFEDVVMETANCLKPYITSR